MDQIKSRVPPPPRENNQTSPGQWFHCTFVPQQIVQTTAVWNVVFLLSFLVWFAYVHQGISNFFLKSRKKCLSAMWAIFNPTLPIKLPVSPVFHDASKSLDERWTFSPLPTRINGYQSRTSSRDCFQ